MRTINETLNPSFNGGVLSTDDKVWTINKIHRKFFTLKVLEQVITSIPIVIYFRKDSYLVEICNEKLDMFRSAGLINYWAELYLQSHYSKRQDAKIGPKMFKIKTLTGAFQIIAIGWLISFTAFAVEVGMKKRRAQLADAF